MALIAGRLGGLAARFTFTRYLAVSICALCVDTALFLMLARIGLPAAWAAFTGYTAGIVVHWGLSIRFVFARNIRSTPTHAQRLSFVLSALVGLAITVGMVSVLTTLGCAAVLAKAAAVTVSFIVVYMVRKYVVFGDR